MKRVKKRDKAQREALDKIIQFTIADLREALDEVGNEDPNLRHWNDKHNRAFYPQCGVVRAWQRDRRNP